MKVSGVFLCWGHALSNSRRSLALFRLLKKPYSDNAATISTA